MTKSAKNKPQKRQKGIKMIKLGQLAKDKITGFKGILTAKVEYLYGCTQYCITPTISKDGKSENSQYFDEGRIQIIGKGILPKDVQSNKPGGINRDAPLH